MALQLIPLGPPATDSFTPLSQIGQSFFKNYDDGRKRKLEDDFAKSNSELIDGMSAPAAPVAAPQGGTLGDMGKPSRALPTFAGDLTNGINQANAKYGLDPSYLPRLAQIESGGNINAKNPNSTAEGPFQFIRSTAAQYGLTNPRDPVQAADAAARLALDNKNALTRALGRDPTPGELYLAHQQGAGGAIKLLSNPDAPASAVVGEQAVALNGGRPGMTAGQFASQWVNKFGGGQPGRVAAAPPPSMGAQDGEDVLAGGAGPASAQIPAQRPPIGLGGGMPQSGGVAPAQPVPQQVAQAGPNADPFGFSRMPPQVAAGVKSLLRNPLPAAQSRGMAIVEMYKKTEQWSDPVTDPRTGAEFQVNRVTGERKIFQQPQDTFTVKIDDQGNRLQVNTRNNQQTMLVAAKDLPTEVKLYNQARADGSFTGPFNDFLLQRQRGARQYQTIDIEVPGSNGKQTFIIDPDTNKLKTPAEMGLKIDANGNANPYSPGGKPTEGQEKSIGFVGRMVNSEKVIQDNENAGLGFGESLSSQVPVVGNFLTSTDFKKYNQAKMDFILAVLRKESGAVIGPSEFDMAARQYFPQPGDPPELVEQKRATRRLAIEGMMAGTGPNYKPPEGYGGPANRGTPGQPPEPPPAPTSPNVPAQGERKLGDVIIPPDAVRDLKAAKDTPQTRKAFDSVFGAGAADKFLGRPK